MLSQPSTQVARSFLALLFASLGFVTVQAPMSRAQDHKTTTMNVTGCLQKGVESGGFTLTTRDGKLWELSGTQKTLAAHAGHKVTVTGREVHNAKLQEAKMERDEKKEAEGKEYGDLHVTKLKMVSSSCQ